MSDSENKQEQPRQSQQPQQQPRQTPQLGQQPETPQAGQQPAPMDEYTKNALEKFNKPEEESVKRVSELFEKRLSGSKIGEVAIGEVNKMKAQQENAIHGIFRARREYLAKQFSEQVKNSGQRDILAQQILKNTQAEIDFQIRNVESVLKILVKGTYITEAEAVELRRTLNGIEKITDAESEKILVKLRKQQTGEGVVELTSPDYQHVIGMMNPLDLTDKDAKPREKFDATTSGILIGLMKPAQRYSLVQELMNSPKSAQTGEVIDGFLKTGILSVAQGRELFRQAVTNGAMSEQQFRDHYEKNINSGFYVDEAKKVQDAINGEIEKLKGHYAVNPLERMVGSPLLGAGLTIHAFFWLLTNILAANGDFKSLFKNPWFFAALGEGAAGIEIATGSMKKGTGDVGMGSGWISRAIESIGEKEGPKSDNQKRALEMVAKVYENYPDFGDYLYNGGVETIMKIHKDKMAQGKQGIELQITYDDLLKEEKNADRLSILKKYGEHMNKDQMTVQISTISQAATILDVKKPEDFQKYLNEFKTQQGLAATPTAVATNATGPATAPAASAPAKPQSPPPATPPNRVWLKT